MAQLCQQFAVVFEIDAQHNWDAEHELSTWDGMEDVARDVLPELNGLLGMAARSKPAALAGKRQKELGFAAGVGASYSGKSLVQVSASQVFLDHLIHHRPEESVLSLAMLVIAGLEVFV
jgi:hypothetical protein